jgi:uncharacterized coiled-coil protein SlyX
MDPIIQKLQNDIVQELNGFLVGLEQSKIGFGSRMQQVLSALVAELETRAAVITQVQGEKADLIKQISALQEKVLSLSPPKKDEERRLTTKGE